VDWTLEQLRSLGKNFDVVTIICGTLKNDFLTRTQMDHVMGVSRQT